MARIFSFYDADKDHYKKKQKIINDYHTISYKYQATFNLQHSNPLTFGICSRSPSSVCRLTLGFARSISKRVCIFSSVNLDTLCPSRCDSNADPERNIWLTEPPILTINVTLAPAQSFDAVPIFAPIYFSCLLLFYFLLLCFWPIYFNITFNTSHFLLYSLFFSCFSIN